MAETEPNPSTNPPPSPEPTEGSAARGDDLARIERWDRVASRVLFFAGLLGIFVALVVAEEHRVPRRLLLAWLATFMAMKLGLLLLGVRARWKAVPALALEIVSLGLVGNLIRVYPAMDAHDPKGVAMMVLAIVLLAAAGLMRRRAA